MRRNEPTLQMWGGLFFILGIDARVWRRSVQSAKCDDVGCVSMWRVYVYRRIYFCFLIYWGNRPPYMFPLIPSSSISLFPKNRSDATGGCSQYFCFFFAIPFFFASKKKVLVYVLLSYTIFLYSLCISANLCTSNLLKRTSPLLILANHRLPPALQTFFKQSPYS